MRQVITLRTGNLDREFHQVSEAVAFGEGAGDERIIRMDDQRRAVELPQSRLSTP